MGHPLNKYDTMYEKRRIGMEFEKLQEIIADVLNVDDGDYICR